MVKNLKKLRQERGISQQALAKAIGISQQSVNKYENHSIEPDIATLIVLSEYFDTTVDYLIGKTNEHGNNIRLSESERMLEKYKALGSKEKLCVRTIVDTFYKIKKG